MAKIERRAVLLGMGLAAAGFAPTGLRAQGAGSARFHSFLEGLRGQALGQGVSAQTFDRVVSGLEPDPALFTMGNRQSEFSKPIKAYVESAASPTRAGRGRAIVAQEASVLGRIEASYGVPKEMLVALYGMETDFGRDMGNRDVVRSLATLAFARPQTPTFRDEFVAALVMLEKGFVTRERLKGSWAGAMGNPQFLPSAYLKYAVSFAGSRAPDIWTSVPDSLASIGNFLRASGWVTHRPWGGEVKVPAGFDYRALRLAFPEWARLGFNFADGAALPPDGDAMLFFPVGARGPAFLLGANFFVLKIYNFSDSYAMSASFLADRIAGRVPVRAAWPDEAHPLDQAERVRLQTLLRALGFYHGEVDGRFGPVTRDAVHAFERAVALMPADGHPSLAVLARLGEEATKRGVR